MSSKRQRRLYLVVTIQLLLIFVSDVWTPGGIALGVLYVIPVVWYGVWSPPSAGVPALIVSAISTVLAVAGLALNMVEDSAGGTVMNRVIAIAALWLCLLVILMRKTFEQKV